MQIQEALENLTSKHHACEASGRLHTLGSAVSGYSMTLRIIQRSNTKVRSLDKLIQFDPPVRPYDHVAIQDNKMTIGSFQELRKAHISIHEMMRVSLRSPDDPCPRKEGLEILFIKLCRGIICNEIISIFGSTITGGETSGSQRNNGPSIPGGSGNEYHLTDIYDSM
jgi:hypothetical protein